PGRSQLRQRPPPAPLAQALLPVRAAGADRGDPAAGAAVKRKGLPRFFTMKQQNSGTEGSRSFRLSKKSKTVAVGGHAPTTATPTGKFYGKLCARSFAPSARFAVKFCRRGYTRGN